MSSDMKKFLNVNLEKVEKMTEIKKNFLEGKTGLDETVNLIKITFEEITPEEFAYSEQKIKDMGFDDATVHDRMNDILDLFKSKIVQPEAELPKGHPIRTYREENAAAKQLIEELKEKTEIYEKDGKFIKNQWLELYDKVNEFNIHLARKQHQLFSMLESKGFDRPSRIMWSFDNAVRDSISLARKLLNEDRTEEFMKQQREVWDLMVDIMDKEEQILFPTSLKMISENEFRVMRTGDDEIGYCLIEKPEGFYPENAVQGVNGLEIMKENEIPKVRENEGFMSDLAGLLSKYGITDRGKKDEVLDVRQGKLTLEQINLIYQHLPVDLSYVDENEIVKFYSDTKHRVFPRSAGVIGRDVKNCHPRESVSTVQEIIDQFRKGTQDEAEFWIEMGDKFIYIYYVAVRDADGRFRGVLEMMQDASRIRSLTGTRKLLTWENEKNEEKSEKKSNQEKGEDEADNEFGLTRQTVIGKIVEKYPYIREFMPTIAPEYRKLADPVQYMIMSRVATLDMIAARGGFKVDEIIKIISDKIREEEKIKN